MMTLPNLAGFSFGADFLAGDFISPLMNLVTCSSHHSGINRTEYALCRLCHVPLSFADSAAVLSAAESSDRR